MVEKSTRDDLAALIGLVRGRLISVLVVVIVALGIVSEAIAIYNGYLQVKINEAELPKRRAEACVAREKALVDLMSGQDVGMRKPDEVAQLELECSPYARARAREEARPPVKLDAKEQIERSTCYQRLRKVYPTESDEKVIRRALGVCSDLAGLSQAPADSQPKN